MIVMLVGPVDYWWNENWGTPQHETYCIWRDTVSSLPEEHRLAISKAMKGVPKNETHRLKMSEGMKESWKRRRRT